jgi:hypothetical protein
VKVAVHDLDNPKKSRLGAKENAASEKWFTEKAI